MSEAQGSLWPVETLAKAQTKRSRRRPRRHRPAAPIDSAFAAAMRDAADILEWTIGRPAPSWRVYRLAQAMVEAGK